MTSSGLGDTEQRKVSASREECSSRAQHAGTLVSGPQLPGHGRTAALEAPCVWEADPNTRFSKEDRQTPNAHEKTLDITISLSR